LLMLIVIANPAACFAPMPAGGAMQPARAVSSRTLRLNARGVHGGLHMVASDVTDADFKKIVIDSAVPTLVSFWAPWCGPCRMIKPVLEQVQEEYAGKLNLVQMNTDENQGTATEYGIRSIPTLMLFKNGERVDTIIGAVPKTTLESKLAQKL